MRFLFVRLCTCVSALIITIDWKFEHIGNEQNELKTNLTYIFQNSFSPKIQLGNIQHPRANQEYETSAFRIWTWNEAMKCFCWNFAFKTLNIRTHWSEVKWQLNEATCNIQFVLVEAFRLFRLYSNTCEIRNMLSLCRSTVLSVNALENWEFTINDRWWQSANFKLIVESRWKIWSHFLQ